MARRLDSYDLPEGQQKYLSIYGYHFSESLAKYAISKMKNRNDKRFKLDETLEILKKHEVEPKQEEVYDAWYLFNMYYSDFYPKAIKDEASLAEAVKCMLNDEDGYEGMTLTRWYADCLGKGEPVMFERFI